jgi:hypothetical protein
MMEYFSGEYYVVKSGDKNYMFYNHVITTNEEEKGDAFHDTFRSFYDTFNMIYRDSEGKLQERIFEASVQLNDKKVIAISYDTFHYLMAVMMDDPTKLASVIQNLIFEKSKSVSLNGVNPEILKNGYDSDEEMMQITTSEQNGVIVTFKPISPTTRKD